MEEEELVVGVVTENGGPLWVWGEEDAEEGEEGETEENFEETLETLKEIRFSGIHVFPYSRRTGTPAAPYPNQISNEIKKERVHRVQALEKGIALDYRKQFLGKVVRVLAEEQKNGFFEGLTDEYIRVSIRNSNIDYKFE